MAGQQHFASLLIWIVQIRLNRNRKMYPRMFKWAKAFRKSHFTRSDVHAVHIVGAFRASESDPITFSNRHALVSFFVLIQILILHSLYNYARETI
jgi:hypothetical protein